MPYLQVVDCRMRSFSQLLPATTRSASGATFKVCSAVGSLLSQTSESFKLATMHANGQLRRVLLQVDGGKTTGCTFRRSVVSYPWLIASSSNLWFPLFLLAFVVRRASLVWRSMFPSSSSYLLLAILQLLQYSCRAGAGSESTC